MVCPILSAGASVLETVAPISADGYANHPRPVQSRSWKLRRLRAIFFLKNLPKNPKKQLKIEMNGMKMELRASSVTWN